MKEDYCIIKLYNETGNEYVVKSGLTFEEASNLLDELVDRNVEPCDFYIGDDFDIENEDDDYAEIDSELEDFTYLL